MSKKTDYNLEALEEDFIAYYKGNGLPEEEAKDIFKLLLKYMENRTAKYSLPGVSIDKDNYKEVLEDVNSKESMEIFLNKITKLYDQYK